MSQQVIWDARVSTESLTQDLSNIESLISNSSYTSKVDSTGTETIGSADNTQSLVEFKQVAFQGFNQITELLKQLLGTVKSNGGNFAGNQNQSDQEQDRTTMSRIAKVNQAVQKTLAIGNTITSGIVANNGLEVGEFNALVNADPLGYQKLRTQRISSNVSIGFNTLAGIGGGLMAVPTPGTMIAGGVLMAIGGLGTMITKLAESDTVKKIEEKNSLYSMYESKMSSIDSFNRAFGYTGAFTTGLPGYKAAYNLKPVLDAANDTGMDVFEFMSNAASMRKFGLGKNTALSEMTKLVNLSNMTGESLESLKQFDGLMLRYRNSSDATNRYGLTMISNAAQDSGLNAYQVPEFLRGLQGVIENGIEKGYTRSVQATSQTMVMFSKLTGGNGLWEGEQGFRRLSKIENGLANATHLNSSSDLLTYQVFSGLAGGSGDQKVINTLKLMEQGLTVENFGKLSESVKSVYSGNTMAQLEFWRNLTGMSYGDAETLMNMDPNSLTQAQKNFIANAGKNSGVATLTNPDVTDQTRLANRSNEVTAAVVNLGRVDFAGKLESLNEHLSVIRNALHKIHPDGSLTVDTNWALATGNENLYTARINAAQSTVADYVRSHRRSDLANRLNNSESEFYRQSPESVGNAETEAEALYYEMITKIIAKYNDNKITKEEGHEIGEFILNNPELKKIFMKTDGTMTDQVTLGNLLAMSGGVFSQSRAGFNEIKTMLSEAFAAALRDTDMTVRSE